MELSPKQWKDVLRMTKRSLMQRQMFFVFIFLCLLRLIIARSQGNLYSPFNNLIYYFALIFTAVYVINRVFNSNIGKTAKLGKDLLNVKSRYMKAFEVGLVMITIQIAGLYTNSLLLGYYSLADILHQSAYYFFTPIEALDYFNLYIYNLDIIYYLLEGIIFFSMSFFFIFAFQEVAIARNSCLDSIRNNFRLIKSNIFDVIFLWAFSVILFTAFLALLQILSFLLSSPISLANALGSIGYETGISAGIIATLTFQTSYYLKLRKK